MKKSKYFGSFFILFYSLHTKKFPENFVFFSLLRKKYNGTFQSLLWSHWSCGPSFDVSPPPLMLLLLLKVAIPPLMLPGLLQCCESSLDLAASTQILLLLLQYCFSFFDVATSPWCCHFSLDMATPTSMSLLLFWLMTTLIHWCFCSSLMLLLFLQFLYDGAKIEHRSVDIKHWLILLQRLIVIKERREENTQRKEGSNWNF